MLLNDIAKDLVDTQLGDGKGKDAPVKTFRKWDPKAWQGYPTDDDSLDLEDDEEVKKGKGMTEEEKKKLIAELVAENIEENKKKIPGNPTCSFLAYE